MNWLALDTSSDALSLLLLKEEDGQVLESVTLDKVLDQQHGASLVPAIQDLLNQLGWQVSNIEAILVGIGPGSYTGLRIGVTLAKIWAKSLDIPLYQISSLAILAGQVTEQSGLLIPLIDARRLSAYLGVYQWADQGLELVQADCYSDWQDWLEQSKDLFSNQKVTLLGKDIDDFVQAFKAKYPTVDCQVVDRPDFYPSVQVAFTTGLIQESADIDILAPNYGHPSVAEQEWAARNQRQIKEEDNEGYIEHFS